MSKEVTKNDTSKSPSSKHAKMFGQKMDAEAYNFVAKHANLATVQLISSNFDVSPEFFEKDSQVKIDLCHHILSVNHYNSDSFTVGIFRYEVIAKIGRKRSMCARSDFMAVYEMPDEAAEYESRAFCARVGLFAAYPYFRAYFAHLMSLSQIDLPALPVLSADPLRRASGKQTTDIER